MSHSLSLSKMRYSYLKSIFRLFVALIASNVWLITERSQLRNEIDDFKIETSSNFEGMKANFNVTEAQITDLEDSFENSEAEKLEMSNTIDKLKVG